LSTILTLKYSKNPTFNPSNGNNLALKRVVILLVPHNKTSLVNDCIYIKKEIDVCDWIQRFESLVHKYRARERDSAVLGLDLYTSICVI